MLLQENVGTLMKNFEVTTDVENMETIHLTKVKTELPSEIRAHVCRASQYTNV